MKLAILAAVAAATLVGSAPAAMAQPYRPHHYSRHHYWHHHWFGHRHFCYLHPYRC